MLGRFGSVTNLTLRLRPSAGLERHVVLQDTRGRPIANARVAATPEPGTCLSPVFTDDEGIFELVCPRLNFIGDVRWLVTADGYRDRAWSERGWQFGGQLGIELETVNPPLFLPRVDGAR